MRNNQAAHYKNVQRLSQSRLPINIISFTLWSFTINFNNLTPNYDLKETCICKYNGHGTVNRKEMCPINTNTYPNNDPKNPFDEFNFFSASAINCIAFCSLSAIFYVKISWKLQFY